MPRVGLEPEFQREEFVPVAADIEAAQATVLADTGIEIGKDTAKVIARRIPIEEQAAALRALGTLPVELYDLLDAMIAAGFDG